MAEVTPKLQPLINALTALTRRRRKRQKVADEAVAAALKSAKELVVVDAPGGCGKTFQGTAFTADAVRRLDRAAF